MLKTTFSTLKPLPGGSHHYLQTLNDMLCWFRNSKAPTDRLFIDWVMTSYKVSEGIAADCISTLVRTLTIQHYMNGQIVLTSMGEKFLSSSAEAQTTLLLDHLLHNFVGLKDALTIFAEAGSPYSFHSLMEKLQPKFPDWHSEAQYRERINWLLSSACLRQIKGKRTFEITEFGQRIYHQFTAEQEGVAVMPSQTEVPLLMPLREVLQDVPSKSREWITQLEDAADERNTAKFIQVMRQIFIYFGFTLDDKAGLSANTILLQAPLDVDSYRVLVIMQPEKVQKLDIRSLQEQQHRYAANYVMVVTSKVGGDAILQAFEHGMTLLTISILAKWLELHDAKTFNLEMQRSMFVTPGLVEPVADLLQQEHDEFMRLIFMFTDFIDFNQVYYPDPIAAMTNLKGGRDYQVEEIREVLRLLTGKLLKAGVIEGDKEFKLLMNRETLAQAFHAIGNLLETLPR